MKQEAVDINSTLNFFLHTRFCHFRLRSSDSPSAGRSRRLVFAPLPAGAGGRLAGLFPEEKQQHMNQRVISDHLYLTWVARSNAATWKWSPECESAVGFGFSFLPFSIQLLFVLICYIVRWHGTSQKKPLTLRQPSQRGELLFDHWSRWCNRNSH